MVSDELETLEMEPQAKRIGIKHKCNWLGAGFMTIEPPDNHAEILKYHSLVRISTGQLHGRGFRVTR